MKSPIPAIFLAIALWCIGLALLLIADLYTQRSTASEIVQPAMILPAQAEEQATVATSIICPLDTIKAISVRLAKSLETASIIGCLRHPQDFAVEFPILDKTAGPFFDVDGDEFWVVKVLAPFDGDWYAIAWPGHNSTLTPATKPL